VKHYILHYKTGSIKIKKLTPRKTKHYSWKLTIPSIRQIFIFFQSHKYDNNHDAEMHGVGSIKDDHSLTKLPINALDKEGMFETLEKESDTLEG
jgi:hypothetical protein